MTDDTTGKEVAEYKPRQSNALQIQTWDQLDRFADLVCDAGMVPYGLCKKDGTPNKAAVMVAVQFGQEVGLSPMQALQNIMVTKGRPTIWGDATPGLIRASGLCEYINEWFEGTGEAFTAVCETKRKGQKQPVRGEFSVADAKRAKLWGKKGYKGEDTPWITHPKRMLQMRARNCLRDAFPDVLKGLRFTEEVEDYPDDGVLLPPERAAAEGVMPNVRDAEVVDEQRERAERYLAHLAKITDLAYAQKTIERRKEMMDELRAGKRGELVMDILDAEKAKLAELAAAGLGGKRSQGSVDGLSDDGARIDTDHAADPEMREPGADEGE